MRDAVGSLVACRLRGPVCRERARGRRGFTIVELIVVIAIIAVVLAIGVPAFVRMTEQQRQSKARQLLSGTLSRTQVIAVSDQTLAAVRIFPAAWNLEKGVTAGAAGGRQMIATYTYRETYAANPSSPDQVKFADRFERVADGPSHLLPPDTWVAPSEALDTVHQVPDLGTAIGDLVLEGTIGQFELDADGRTDSGEKLLDADDFLIVFDPQAGLRGSLRRTPWRLLGFDPRSSGPTAQLETDGQRNSAGKLIEAFQRFNFTGVVIYEREKFTALGPDAQPDQRRTLLERVGQMFYVNRTGGSLVPGSGEGAGGS